MVNKTKSLFIIIVIIGVFVVGYSISSPEDNKNIPPSVPGTEENNVEKTVSEVSVNPSISNLDASEATSLSGLIEGANEFSFDMYSELASNDSNAFLSPYSIHTCLAMAFEGARGDTREEMRKALNLPKNNLNRQSSFAKLEKQLRENRIITLKTANSLWPQKDYPFYESYIENIKKYYLAKIESEDYKNNRSEAVEKINNWAAKHTENKIEKIVQKESISHSTRLVLTNAIYFKGDWVIPFDESRTDNEKFYLSDGSTVQAPFMQFNENRISENRFLYSETNNVKALKLFYSGKNVSMNFILPKKKIDDGLTWLRNNLDKDKYNQIQDNFSKEKMSQIKIPKFEFRSKYKKKMKNGLKNLGIKNAFNGQKANFSGIDGTRKLFISQVIHKGYVKVDEQGTEATAVTAVGMRETAIPDVKSFVANRPFMFVIWDEKTGEILFVGSVINPSK